MQTDSSAAEASRDQDTPLPLWRRLLLPSPSQRLRMLRRDAWLVVIASYVLLAAAYLWPQDFRATSPAYNLACYVLFLAETFVWHIGLVILLIALLAAWRRAWRLAAATVPLLLVTLGPEVYHCLPQSPPPIQGEAVTVMSVNLLCTNPTPEAIIGEIRAADPDILLLQEYSPHWHEAIREAIGARYPYAKWVVRPDPFGAAIYSRLPFEDDVRTDLHLAGVETPQMRAVVRIGGRRVALYNIHLVPPYGLELTATTRHQLADLIEHLDAEPLPMILSGDFNFTDRSENAALLRAAGLTDTHRTAGWGRGSTWPVNGILRYLPGLRLDHIYLSDSLTCAHSRTGEGIGSDHRPIVAKIGLAEVDDKSADAVRISDM